MELLNFNLFFNSLLFWAVLLVVANGVEFFIRKKYLGVKSTSNLGAVIFNALIIIFAAPFLLKGFTFGAAIPQAIRQFFLFEIAFFIVHLAVVLMDRKPRKDEIIHHLISGGGLFITLALNKGGFEVFLILLLAEASFCFFLYLFMKSIRQNKLAKRSWEWYKVIFVAVRLFMITPLCIYFIYAPLYSIGFKLFAIAFTTLNIYWVRGIWKSNTRRRNTRSTALATMTKASVKASLRQ